MKSRFNKLMFNSVARFALAGLSFYLTSKGIDAATAESISSTIAGFIPGLAVGGVSLAWSANDVMKRATDASRETVNLAPEKPVKGYFLSERSLTVLNSVNPLLHKLFSTAIVNSPYDFTCYHGLRTQAEQDEMVRSGVSRVTRSKHQDGQAVDFFIWKDGKVSWTDYAAYEAVGNHIKDCAKRLNIPITWGGDWKTFKDYVHIELSDEK